MEIYFISGGLACRQYAYRLGPCTLTSLWLPFDVHAAVKRSIFAQDLPAMFSSAGIPAAMDWETIKGDGPVQLL